MVYVRAIMAWIALMAVESIHGMVRAALLVPVVGDWRSRQLGVFTGGLLIVGTACALIRWLDARNKTTLLLIGLAWVGMTIAFEFILGRWAFHYSWDRLLSDYDLSRGGLMPFGLAALAASPMIACRLRRLPPFSGE